MEVRGIPLRLALAARPSLSVPSKQQVERELNASSGPSGQTFVEREKFEARSTDPPPSSGPSGQTFVERSDLGVVTNEQPTTSSGPSGQTFVERHDMSH